MHLKHWLVAAAVVASPCAGAFAQDAQTAPQTQSSSSYTSGDDNHWLASGFVGSNFANNAQPASMNFGASVAYLWKNTYGAELDTGFAPSFQLQNNFFGTGVRPDVNSYMANAIWAKPFGDEGRFQPFVSGGVGAISLRSGVTTGATAFTPNDTRFGGDVGGGVMAFSGNWGFKADVRYLRATGTYNSGISTTASPTQPNPTPAPGPYGISTNGAGATAVMPPSVPTPPNAAATSLAGAALSGLHFWRANVGVALRW
jgi:hypothetical protein